jgi:hypothetical protein
MVNLKFNGPINIGSEEMITINELVRLIANIAGKNLFIKNLQGPVGVRGRNSDNTIFQNTKTLILYQDGSLVDEINMEDEVALNKVLNKFINHKTTIIKDYEAELSNFIIHIPQIANLLTNLINS